MLEIESGVRTTIVHGGSRAHYVPSGHLVYASGESLYAVQFDPVRLTVHGAGREVEELKRLVPIRGSAAR